MTPIHATREQWLTQATANLRTGLFKQLGAEIPTIRLSVGFPGGSRGKKAIGQYWPSPLIADAVPQVFVSPVIGDPVRALEVEKWNDYFTKKRARFMRYLGLAIRLNEPIRCSC